MKTPAPATRRAFSLLELLVSVLVLSMLIAFLGLAAAPVMNMWNQGERRSDTYHNARSAMELFARELTPAVVDTRMQFVVMPGEELEDVGAPNIAPNSFAILWMAPLGERNQLHSVGYFLSRNEERLHYRLKRIFISPANPDGYHPQLVSPDKPRSTETRTSATNAKWFTRYWDESALDDTDPANRSSTVVSTVADGVIACWIQPYDLLGNPIPWLNYSDVHPDSSLIYNSAAYFHVATTEPFDDDKSFVFLAEHDLVMKANRVPAEVEIVIFTVDKETLIQGKEVPEMTLEFKRGNNATLDLEASVRAYEAALEEAGINTARRFSTRVKLLNGS